MTDSLTPEAPTPEHADDTAAPGLDGRTALLRATISVALAEGLSGVTSRSVAEAAGVAHSLVRYHFGTLDSLVTEALGLAIDEGVAHAQRLADATSLAEFTQNLENSVLEHQDTHAFLHEALLESRRRPELLGQVERYFRDYRGAISQQLVRLGIDDPGLVDVIYFAIEGMIFKEVAYPDQVGTRGAIVRLQKMVAEATGLTLPPEAAAGYGDDDAPASGSSGSEAIRA